MFEETQIDNCLLGEIKVSPKEQHLKIVCSYVQVDWTGGIECGN